MSVSSTWMSLSRVGAVRKQNEVGFMGILQPVTEGVEDGVWLVRVSLLHPQLFQDELHQRLHVGGLVSEECVPRDLRHNTRKHVGVVGWFPYLAAAYRLHHAKINESCHGTEALNTHTHTHCRF